MVELALVSDTIGQASVYCVLLALAFSSVDNLFTHY